MSGNSEGIAKREANVVPHKYKPGQSGNPKGRPKGTPNVKTVIKKWLKVKEEAKNPISGKMSKLTQMDIIALAQLSKARKGDTTAFNALLDRVEGKPKQELEHTGDMVVNWHETKTYEPNPEADDRD